MSEEKGLFKKDRNAAFYRKIIFLAKRMQIIFLYFCIAMNVLVIGMIVIGDPNIGIIFFGMNTIFLIVLMVKLRKEKKNV